MEQHNGERRQASKTLSRKAARCGNGRKFPSNINSSQGQPLTAERHRCVDPSNFAQQIEWTGKMTDFKSTDVAPTQMMLGLPCPLQRGTLRQTFTATNGWSQNLN